MKAIHHEVFCNKYRCKGVSIFFPALPYHQLQTNDYIALAGKAAGGGFCTFSIVQYHNTTQVPNCDVKTP